MSLLTLSPSQCRTPPPQLTPKLPRRERLNSLSRLLRRRNLVEAREGPAPVGLAVDRRFLSPSQLQISPATSPKPPSPAGSPLYSPDPKKTYLGRGSFGQVVLCQYKGRPLAAKVTRGELCGERLLLGVRHPNLVRVYHVSDPLEGARLVLMEFAGHCNLQQLLDARSELRFRRSLSFCVQTAEGLSQLHSLGLVHGDVKPANVLVSPRGVCKLGDFGLSRREGEPAAGGTPAYAAPEVLRGGEGAGRPSDVFSLGVLLWQVHSREAPFAGDHPHVIIYKVVHYDVRPRFPATLNPALSSFAAVAEHCWSGPPEERPSAAQALAALRDVMRRPHLEP